MNFQKLVLASSISALALAGCGSDKNSSDKVETEVSAQDLLSSKITTSAVESHLINLQRIAEENRVNDVSTRAAGTPGYDSSTEYIKAQLEAAGYEVKLQSFEFRLWEQMEPSSFVLSTVSGKGDENITQPQNPEESAEEFSYNTMSYSGSALIDTAKDLVFVTPSFSEADDKAYDYSDGCEASDFEGKEIEGKIAVIQRGSCAFDKKASNAEAVGAVAVIIFNDGNGEGRMATFGGTLGEDTSVSIPVLSSSYDLGLQIFQLKDAQATIKTSTTDKTVNTNNVITETKEGNAEQVVMLGAHLDSVNEGPGINDNGTGSAGLLEYAIQFAKSEQVPENKMRFAWWSAEEAGLIGSQHYVDSTFRPIQDELFKSIAAEFKLDPSDLDSWTNEQYNSVLEETNKQFTETVDVAMYLNFDMIGSPNPVYFVYDGDLSDTMEDEANAYDETFLPPHGTADIEATFNGFFNKNNLETAPSALAKRSDYAGFANYGIAFGGLFTGAEVNKSEEEAATWGGTAGEAYDKCYHKECDDIINIESETLTYNSKALAYVGTTYAMRSQLFPAVSVEEKSNRKLINKSTAIKTQTANYATRGMKYDVETGLAKYISHGHGDLYYK